ncbi:hypothetical protein [Arthrobacter sp. efr-133-TYG-120]|uniref:hypothetical protein n=1 Tax=Arthrobacter sp. efr-133-TYG-120 TaxID=3040280 RepID=UPI0025508C0F|nr:hypothetical protein [Arthrobacter sp. efr-133-TYG-120]
MPHGQLDSNGKKLPTSYTVNGPKIIQHVNTNGAAYPIVADPSIQWIPYPVVAMYGWEADTIRNIGNVWQSSSGLLLWGCYGFGIWNPGAGAIPVPARDCA